MYLGEKIARWIVGGGAVLLALSPFFVNPQTVFPAVFLRVVLVRLIIEVMFLAYLFLALCFPSYRPRRSSIALAVGAFVAVSALSTVLGVNPYRSFWGSHERMEGYVTLLHFGILFLALWGTFHRTDEFKKVLWASVIVSVAQFFYAFGQIPGIDVAQTKLYANETTRISGTFGNATIFALYVLFQLFFALMLFFWERASWKRALLGVIAALGAVSLYFSGTRGALAGSYLGFAVLIFAAAFWSERRWLRRAAQSLLVLALLGFGALWYFRDAVPATNNLLQRALVISEAPKSRLIVWRVGLESWRQRFWLGYGMENFNYAFNRFYNPRLIIYDRGDFDRAHNRFVDTVVTGGFLGLVAYLAIYATAAVFLIRRWMANRSFFFPVAALALLAAYPIQLFALFDHLISYQMFAIFLALLAVWQSQEKARSGPVAALKGNLASHPSFSLPRMSLLVLVVVATAIFAWRANIQPVEASYWAQVASGLNYVSQGRRFPEAFQALRRSFDLGTYLNVDMRLALHGFALGQARTLRGEDGARLKKEVLEYLEAQFKKNLTEHHPDIKDFLTHVTYAQIAEQLAEYDPAWLGRAAEVLQAGTEEYPYKYQPFQALARLYVRQGRYGDAIGVYKRAPMEFAPGPFVFDYAAMLLTLGRLPEGREALRLTIENGYDFRQHLDKLVEILTRSKDYELIARIYENQIAYYPDDLQLLASLAQTYKETGDLDKARRLAETLLGRNPSNRQETEKFLQSLGGGR